MSQPRKCEICLEKPAVHRCPLCGRYVCEDHFDHEKGVCIACSEALCSICGKRLSIGYCKYCGRLVCEECSVKEGAALVCKECAAARGLI